MATTTPAVLVPANTATQPRHPPAGRRWRGHLSAARSSRTPLARPLHQRREQGAATAELVVATPLLLLMLLVVVQFAVWLHAVHIAQAGADQALAAARTRGGTTAAGQAQADTVLSQLGAGVLHDALAVVTATGTQVRVEVSGNAEAVVPGMHLPVRVVAAGPVENWTTP
jgi:Flp pilus assembly protein TadG